MPTPLLATLFLLAPPLPEPGPPPGPSLDEPRRPSPLEEQTQGVLLLALADADSPVAGEIEYNTGYRGLGAALGAGYDRLGWGDGRTWHGGHVRWTFQWRFLNTWVIDPDLTRWVDPHVDFGGWVGGADTGSETVFQGAGYLGAGMDIRLFAWDTHLVATVQYRWLPEALRDPDGLPVHHLVVGLGLRDVTP